MAANGNQSPDDRTNGERRFITTSSRPVERVYEPADVTINYEHDLGAPGQYPYTRGVHASGYRGKPWTMRSCKSIGPSMRIDLVPKTRSTRAYGLR